MKAGPMTHETMTMSRTATGLRRRAGARFLTVAATAVATMLLTTLPPALAGPVGHAPSSAGAAAIAPLPRVAAAAAAAAPVGKLTPRGCAEGIGTASCDLFAMAGTASLLGVSTPIWGFSTTGAAALGHRAWTGSRRQSRRCRVDQPPQRAGR